MKITDFDYVLPNHLIANKPKDKRDESDLLVLNRNDKTININKFKNLESFFNPGDLIILNDTKVIPARLIGEKPTGGRVDVTLLNKVGDKTWETLVKPGKRFKEKAILYFNKTKDKNKFYCEVLKILEDGKRIIKFYYRGNFYDQLLKYGQMPLPPYIKNTPLSEKDIRKKYQTVFARESGAAAAPTAGLHFTRQLIKKLKKKGINFGYLTLHVNAGTFLPVKEENIKDHKMYQEYYKIPNELIKLIKKTKQEKNKIVACGTTTLRALETVYNSKIKNKSKIEGWTDIYIYPGYKFKIVDNLITNFHLPKSTLFLLVCAFASKDMIFKAYKRAITENLRFYSFGDAMLIL